MSNPMIVNVRGHEIKVTPVEDGVYDIEIARKGEIVVTGIYDGGLTLSEYSPAGKPVALKDSLVDDIEDEIADLVESFEEEEEDDDDEEENDDDDDCDAGTD